MNEYINELQILNTAFDKLNKKYFDNSLKKCVITIQSSLKAYGHFTTKAIWQIDKNISVHEINISAENLGNRDKYSLLATLCHEMVHYYCNTYNIKDTSRNGRYHNEKFKDIAIKCDLNIAYDEKIGWSLTEPTEQFKTVVDTFKLDFMSLFRHTFVKPKKETSKQSMRKYVCPICGLSIRLCKDNANIKCVDCDTLFIQEKAVDN